MPDSILVDTDILIDFLRGYNKAIAFIDEFSSRIILSPIVIAELYAGVQGNDELTILDNFISLFHVVPLTSEIAKLGGLYKRDFGTSYGVKLADAILAATVEVENAKLKTLSVKHYPMFKDLKPAYKK